jgi:hypothetical protein
MLNAKKTFFEGLNGDDDIRLLDAKEYLNAENLRMNITEDGRNGRMENIPSTIALTNSYLPTGTNTTIGSVIDTARERIVYFNYNSNGNHGIYAYDINSATFYKVLLNAQVTGGLNFSLSYRVWRNARVLADMLLFTDNYNEPRCISIERGIKLNHSGYTTTYVPYASPLSYETLTLIKRPPNYPIVAAKMSDSYFVNNFIQNNAYQFSYYYIYRDYQQSALAPYSNLAPYNGASDTYNFVNLAIPLTEQIPDYAQKLCICVKYGNTGKTFTVKTYDKNITADATAISNHNSATTQLTYNFYDNIGGIALDDIAAEASFDNVCLKAMTLEIARNRVFLANVLKGYDTPLTTSLSASVVNTGSSAATYSATWGYVTLHANWGSVGGCQDSYMYPFAYSTTSQHKFYYFPGVRVSTIWNGGTYAPDLTSPQVLTSATVAADTEATFISNLKFLVVPYSPTCTIGFPTWQTTYQISYDYYGTSMPVTLQEATPATQGNFFKSSSNYSVTIEFKDRFNRKSGVVQAPVSVTTPARTYTQNLFTSSIQWTLSNTNALTEIPDWAYYYQIVVQKNLTTRFFQQIRAKGLQYVVKNQDGTFTYSNTYTFGTTYATGIDITAFNNYGLGYTYNEGDFAIVTGSDDIPHKMAVLGVDGNFVHLAPRNLGTGSTTAINLIELYQPYKPSVTEPYYEAPAVYAIVSAGTSSRQYGTLTGTIAGDCYAIQRTDGASASYYVEAMSPNDNLWQIWQTNAGFINLIDTIGQQQKGTSIDFSDTYINGTKVNGTAKFQALNTTDLGSESGSIQKIILTNKLRQENGSVMLAICQNLPNSIYLGETQVVASAQNAFLAQSLGVIGTINALRNNNGTNHPESVVDYMGDVFWFDDNNGCFVRYSNDGVFPISDYKMRRYFRKVTKRYNELGSAGVAALCGFSHFATSIDPFHKEVLVVVPQTETTGYSGDYPSYTSTPAYATTINNKLDVYDGKAKTACYRMDANKWMGFFEFLPEWMDFTNNILYAFKNGVLYQHNADRISFNNFYGTNYASRIAFAANKAVSTAKDVLNIAVEGNYAPDFTVVYADNPNVQVTDLIASDYKYKELAYRANVYRDRLSPNATGTAEQKMQSGDLIKDVAPKLLLEFQQYSARLTINFVDVGMKGSLGNPQIEK